MVDQLEFVACVVEMIAAEQTAAEKEVEVVQRRFPLVQQCIVVAVVVAVGMTVVEEKAEEVGKIHGGCSVAAVVVRTGTEVELVERLRCY